MVRRVDALAREFGAELVVLDPAVPLGLIGPSLELPYDVVLHGAEVTVPGRLPGSKQALAHVLRNARHVIAAGEYPAAEAERAAGRSLPTTVVPPGVDIDRFRPLDRSRARRRPRRLRPAPSTPGSFSACRGSCRARASTLRSGRSPALRDARIPTCVLAIAGGGRDDDRLARLAADLDAPVRFLGRVANDDLPRLYGCADVFTMLCRNRWGGLEQEGFGIVFVEAAACGVPQVAGDSGGAAEAVADGETGHRGPTTRTTSARRSTPSRRLLDDDARAGANGRAARAAGRAPSSPTTCSPPGSGQRSASDTTGGRDDVGDEP